jgi:hypothetical protein
MSAVGECNVRLVHEWRATLVRKIEYGERLYAMAALK